MRRCVLISNTPTLAVVGGTYLPESGQLTSKVVVLHRPEWFGEDVGKLLVRAYVPELYLLSLFNLDGAVSRWKARAVLKGAILSTSSRINRPPTGGDLTFSWKKGHI